MFQSNGAAAAVVTIRHGLAAVERVRFVMKGGTVHRNDAVTRR